MKSISRRQSAYVPESSGLVGVQQNGLSLASPAPLLSAVPLCSFLASFRRSVFGGTFRKRYRSIKSCSLTASQHFFLRAFSQARAVLLDFCSVPCMLIGRANERAALDAERGLVLHVGRHWCGASECGVRQYEHAIPAHRRSPAGSGCFRLLAQLPRRGGPLVGSLPECCALR